MSDVIQILVSTPAATAQPMEVIVEEPEESPVAVALPAEQPLTVEVREAMPGANGANAEIVVLSLNAYLALSPEEQMSGKWFVIPK